MTRSTCAVCGTRLTMGDPETVCSVCDAWKLYAPSLLARLRQLLRALFGRRS